jgi:hypothetical protein
MSVMQGDLSEYALPDLLQFLQGMRKQGQLLVESPQASSPAGIYFDDGEVIHAYCPPREGVTAFYQLLRWRQGHFVFLKGAKSHTRTITSDLHNLLLEGLRLLDEHRHIEDQLPPPNTVLHVQRDHSEVEDLRLTQSEWRMVGLVNGRRTMEQVIQLSQREEQEAQRIIYGLITSGLILTRNDDRYLAVMVPEKIPAGEASKTRAAPPTMLANLVLKQIDGKASIRDIKIRLNCVEAELIDEFTLLMRTGWVRLAQGQDAYERYCR